MRYFLRNFESVYNPANPFGAYPEWQYYPKTGTHVGTDFKVPVGTEILAPMAGEMFKTEFNQYKGNVGIYVFEYKGVTWGLELCHLRERPPLGAYAEKEVIAHSGNTGSATTGAHLHAVLHLDAKVTKHYQELQSREAFLRLEKEGQIVDCYKWFRDRIAEELVPEPVIIDTSVIITSEKDKASLLKSIRDFLNSILAKFNKKI